MAANFAIITDGFITEPYASQYNLQPKQGQNTLREIDGNKYGVIVTLTATGKSTITRYHEVENLNTQTSEKLEGFPDEDTRNFWLQKLADDYALSPNY